MGPMLQFLAIVVCVISGIFIVMWALGKRARVREADARREQVIAAIAETLEPVARLIGGTVVDGPELRTDRGALAIVATQPHKRPVIDVTRFTLERESSHILELVPVQDASAALPFKNVRPVTTGDADIDGGYRIMASDESFARRVVTPELVARLRLLDNAVNVRSRLRIATKSVTILAAKGLLKPEELKSFYDGCVAILDQLLPAMG